MNLYVVRLRLPILLRSKKLFKDVEYCIYAWFFLSFSLSFGLQSYRNEGAIAILKNNELWANEKYLLQSISIAILPLFLARSLFFYGFHHSF
ncbi:MAG: hypothetical protein PUG96_00420 [Prevotellaceae bacterium]|nr:hypothetical protein [Prevotellaceae bacterium]MDY4218736.1 hypothetical protein [Prevotella sp.]